jgi:hypothetical protein
MRAVIPYYNNNEEIRYENKIQKNEIYRMMMVIMNALIHR